MNCPICFREDTNLRYEVYDDRYGFPGVFQLLVCASCRHHFTPVDFSPEFIQHLYKTYYPRSCCDASKVEPYKAAGALKSWVNGGFSSAFRWVPARVKVLDIGCGLGEALGYHESRGCEAYGVEADENVRGPAEDRGYKIHVGLFAAGLFSTDFFDCVTLDQVMEHVADPVDTLRAIAQILKPGGKVIVSTPNANGWGAKAFGKRWLHWHVPYHLHFFSVQSMRMAAEQAGLVLALTRTITRSEWLHYQWMHLLHLPIMGYPSAFWAVDRSPEKVRKNAVKILKVGHYLGINHAVTRLFDALGLGDNALFVLRKPH